MTVSLIEDFLYSRHYPKHFKYIFFNLHKFCEVGIIIIAIYSLRKLSHREGSVHHVSQLVHDSIGILSKGFKEKQLYTGARPLHCALLLPSQQLLLVEPSTYACSSVSFPWTAVQATHQLYSDNKSGNSRELGVRKLYKLWFHYFLYGFRELCHNWDPCLLYQ